MVNLLQSTARVNMLYMLGSERSLGVLLKGDYSAAVLETVAYTRGTTVAAFTLSEGDGLTVTLRAAVYYNPDTGDVKYTSGTGYENLGQYTEVLINPSSVERTTLSTAKHDYVLKADGEPLVSGLLSAKLYGGEACNSGCVSSPDVDVLVAPIDDMVVLVGFPAPTAGALEPDLNNTVGDGLTGVVDGANMVYTLSRSAVKSKTAVYYEGMKTTDFEVAGTSLTMGFPPEAGISFVVDLY